MHRESTGPPRVEPSDPPGYFACCGHRDPLHVGHVTEATVFQRTCPRCGLCTARGLGLGWSVPGGRPGAGRPGLVWGRGPARTSEMTASGRANLQDAGALGFPVICIFPLPSASTLKSVYGKAPRP